MTRNHVRVKPINVDLDICVLTAGREEMLEMCLNSIQQDLESFSGRAKVHLFFNGLRKPDIIHPVVDVTDSVSVNKGFPYGANRAIRMGTSKLVLFISDDIKIKPGYINTLYNFMKENEDIGLCGAKLLFPEKSSDPIRPAGKVQHIGHAINMQARVIHPLIGWSSDNPRCNIIREVQSVTGATFIVRRDAFEKVRGFDEVYGLGTFEDFDMALKIRSIGLKIWVNTDAVAYHYVGATAEVRKEPFPLQQNYQIFVQRWMSQGMLVWDEWTYY